MDHTYTNDSVPKLFRNVVKCFFDSAKTIERYYSRVRIAAWRHVCEDKEEEMVEIAIDSFKQLIGKMKNICFKNHSKDS